MEFVKRTLVSRRWNPEVLAWDDASNNRSSTPANASPSTTDQRVRIAKKTQILVPGTQQPIAEVIDHINTPRGPKDRKAHNRFLLRRHLELLEKRRASQGLPAVPLPA